MNPSSFCAFLCLFVALFPSSFSALAAEKNKDTRVFELRTYHAAPGKLDALHGRFRDHTVKLFSKHGIENIGYWVPVKNDGNVLTYFVAYPSREAREESWKAFKDDPDWKAAYAASTAGGKLVEKVDSTFMTLTPWSPPLPKESSDTPRVFELRTYTTNPGKLPNINARFRDHTIELFKKHGMTNLAYFNLMDDQEGAENTLVYMLAFDSEENRNAAFKAFGQDPAWKKVAQESQVEGPILIKGGVKSVIMTPADYSPLK